MKRTLFTCALLLAVVAAAPLLADDEQTKKEAAVFQDKGYMFFQTTDGAYKYWFDGRAQIDAGWVLNSDNDIPWGTETRRARLGLKAIFNKDWAAEIDFDHSENEIEIKDMWAAYIGIENTIIKFGNHKPAGALEELTSSRWVSFIERSLINGFAQDRRIGVSLTHYGDNFMINAGTYGEAPAMGEDYGDEGYMFGARGAFAPIIDEMNVLHIGGNFVWSTPNADSGDSIRFRGRESHIWSRFVDTAKIKNVDDYMVYGVEGAYRMGSLSFQAEYQATSVNRMEGKGEDPSFDGFYAFVSWFPFGGMRTYEMESGEFANVKLPKDSKAGALELLARYSHLDLNDDDAAIYGGEGNYVTLGGNWYFNENVRIMVNYIFTDHDENADANGSYLGNDDHQIFITRMAFFF